MSASWTGGVRWAGRAAIVGVLALIGAGCSKDSPTQPRSTPAKVSSIAFYTDRDGNFEIYVMNANGTGQAPLTNNAGESESFDPAWSPDGTRIAFGSNRDGNAEIYVMNANGTGQTRLTNNAASDSAPNWGPLK